MGDLLELEMLAEQATKKVNLLITVVETDKEKYVVIKHYSGNKSIICYGTFEVVKKYLTWLISNNDKEWQV